MISCFKLKTHSLHLFLFLSASLLFVTSPASAIDDIDPMSLPLIGLKDFKYQGAFAISGAVYGESSAEAGGGVIEYNPDNHSLYLVGHPREDAIAEFPIPALVNSGVLSELNVASVPLQNFVKVLNKTPDSNPQAISVVTGIKRIGKQLLVNGVEYYDGKSDNTHTSLAVRNASSLSDSPIVGYFELEGRAHIAGWMSSIPEEWQSALGGKYISGSASNYPINSRLSIGPTAFIFDPRALTDTTPSGVIPTTALLDFSLKTPLHTDRRNESRKNSLWTLVSRAQYGFIVPSTRTYVTIGSSGGHDSGVGYKITQDTGRLCGGYCTYIAADNYNYYWLWDVNDFVAVKAGSKKPYELRPYAYGKFPAPFQTDVLNGNKPEFHSIAGATYDSQSNTLYIAIKGGVSSSKYSNAPVITAYKLDIKPPRPKTPTNLMVIKK